MKVKHIILSVLILLTVLVGCKKEEIVPLEPTLQQQLQGAWRLDSIRWYENMPSGIPNIHTSVYEPRRHYYFVADSVFVAPGGQTQMQKYKAYRGSNGQDSLFLSPSLGYHLQSLHPDSARWQHGPDFYYLHKI